MNHSKLLIIATKKLKLFIIFNSLWRFPEWYREKHYFEIGLAMLFWKPCSVYLFGSIKVLRVTDCWLVVLVLLILVWNEKETKYYSNGQTNKWTNKERKQRLSLGLRMLKFFHPVCFCQSGQTLQRRIRNPVKVAEFRFWKKLILQNVWQGSEYASALSVAIQSFSKKSSFWKSKNFFKKLF